MTVIGPVLVSRFQSVNINLSLLQRSIIAVSPRIVASIASKAAESNQAGVFHNQPSRLIAWRGFWNICGWRSRLYSLLILT
jgi:hypothetical protein